MYNVSQNYVFWRLEVLYKIKIKNLKSEKECEHLVKIFLTLHKILFSNLNQLQSHLVNPNRNFFEPFGKRGSPDSEV